MSTVWIKICGNTNVEDALHAAAAGADALGFVFATSLRRVTTAQARDIISQLSGNVETYGVFTDATADEIVRTVIECGLSGVQLHRAQQIPGYDPHLALKLRRRFIGLHHGSIRILSVLSFAPEDATSFAEQIEAAAAESDAVLVDARVPHAAGGTGTTFAWDAAQPSFHKVRDRVRTIVAGGLRQENVGAAVQALDPWGVDVVTGVEMAPGRKDQRRVEAFIQAARGLVASIS